ncbi:MAG: ribosome maturation factor RimM [Actinomycetota bacterium]|nr:ribosome maturation factor RimM [Actinomycetota bacterium]
MELSDPVVIGFVAAPHGTRGTVKVRPAGSGRHLREGVEPVIAGRRMRISHARQTPKGFLLDLEGVGDRSRAAALRGEELRLDRRELDAPEEGEFYVGDLIGLIAKNDGGEVVGVVDETFETPAHEILVIRNKDEPALPERYVPFTAEHVPELDLAAGQVVVRVPEG